MFKIRLFDLFKKKNLSIKMDPKQDKECPSWVLSFVKHNLDGKDIYLHDYENTYYLPKEARNDPDAIHFVFGGKEAQLHWDRHKRIADVRGKISFILNDKTEKNGVDQMIAAVTGVILGHFVPHSVTIVSDDHGYEACVRMLRQQGCPIELKRTYLHEKPPMEEKQNFRVDEKYLEKIMRDALTFVSPSTLITASDLRQIIMKSRLYKVSPQERYFVIGALQERGYIEYRQIMHANGTKNGVYQLKPKKQEESEDECI